MRSVRPARTGEENVVFQSGVITVSCFSFCNHLMLQPLRKQQWNMRFPQLYRAPTPMMESHLPPSSESQYMSIFFFFCLLWNTVSTCVSAPITLNVSPVKKHKWGIFDLLPDQCQEIFSFELHIRTWRFLIQILTHPEQGCSQKLSALMFVLSPWIPSNHYAKPHSLNTCNLRFCFSWPRADSRSSKPRFTIKRERGEV